MRTSNKILLGVAAVILLAGLISIVGVRILSQRYLRQSSVDIENRIFSEDEWITAEFQFSGFDRLKFLGGWEIELEQGDSYEVTVELPGPLREYLVAEKKGDTLVLDASDIISLRQRQLSARIMLPDLQELKGAGGLQVDMRGFTGKNLTLETSGAMEMAADECRFENLTIEVSGGVTADLRDMPVVNADVNSSGAADLKLRLDGGRLTGHVSGAANIEYYGKVSENSLSVSGISNVEHKGR